MLKFQVTAASSSSNRCSPTPQRLSQISSSSSDSHSSSAAIEQNNMDRSIDELEEFVVQQTPNNPPYPPAGDRRSFYDTLPADECVASVASAVPFRHRFGSPSPSLSDLSSSSPSSSSSSCSSSSLHCVTLGRRKSPAPQPPIPKRMAGEWSYLRVYTAQIKTDTDYKTLRVPAGVNTECVIRQLVLDKLRLSLRDLNLFHLFMEVRTRRTDGTEARSILELDRMARPLELQKCQPNGMSRFILGMDSNAILARIYDGDVNPESNYKSVLISRRTCCAEVLQMLCQMSRPSVAAAEGSLRPAKDPRASSKGHRQLGLEAISELRLFVDDGPRGVAGSALIPAKCPLAGVYTALMPGQRIVLRRVIVPRAEAFS